MSKLPVTDLELMLYADGELDGDRLAEVEAELARSERARRVVASIRRTGDLLRAQVDETAGHAGADDVAAAVMRTIEAARLEEGRKTPSVVRGPSSWWYAMGGLAAAAAVAMVVWRVVGAGLATQVADGPAPSGGPASVSGTEVASARLPAPDYDPEPSVSVDAVDFGARTGTIFYVPADKGTTTIVWLSDDESGGM
jgi:anti-sigma factor RsiW